MAKTLTCPIKGFEKVGITFPEADELTMAHYNKFYSGFEEAPAGASYQMRLVFGAVALCDDIEGIDAKNVLGMPINYSPVFDWIVNEVYVNTYAPAVLVPKNS